MISVLTPLPVLLPLLGAAGTLLVGRHPRTQRTISLTVLTAVLAVSVSCRPAMRRSSSSLATASLRASAHDRWIIASTNAVMPKVITIAVRMNACGSGSLMSSGRE